MMEKQTMTVKNVRKIADETYEMVLENKYVSDHAVPGQFLHISVPNLTLRRPISIADLDRDTGTVTIIYKIVGKGTETLSTYVAGMEVDVLGPTGQGFPINSTTSSALLIGGGVGIPPLHFLAKQLKASGIQVNTILGFQTKSTVFYEEKFKELGQTFITTDDGTYGEKGLVTSMINKVDSFERYYSCGPLPMMKAVKDSIENVEGYLSFEERMGCGVGTCLACVIPTNDEKGYKKICQDGPVLSANEVLF